MYGNLRIRIRVCFSRTDRREHGRMIVVRTIGCEQEEAREEFRKFVELNPHLEDRDLRAEFTFSEIIN